jgi:hypothetical protein
MRLYELSTKSVVVMFSYSNPPTKEYDIYYKELIARSKNSDHIVYLNPMVDKEINPLSFVDNLRYNRTIFPNINFSNNKDNKISKILKDLSSKYTDIVILVKKEDREVYEQYRLDAEKLGFINYIVEVINEEHNYNIEARQAVIDNDYNEFVKKFSTTNKNILSQLFITLRKTMLLGSTKKLNESNAHNTNKLKINVVHEAIQYGSGINILDSVCTTDKFGNKVFKSKKFNQNIIEMKHLTKPMIGFDKVDKKDAIFVPELSEQYLYNNKDEILSLMENTVASNVASTSNILGEPIRRVDNITGILPQVKDEQDKLSAAIRVFINQNGYIDSTIIQKITKEIGDEI